jgi:hypothetical protein
MKFLLLTVIILASACGKYEVAPRGSTRVGEALTVSPLSSLDRSNLSSICNALSSKTVTAGSTLTFKQFEGDCTGNTISNADVQTVIEQVGSNFVIKRKLDGRDFIFPEVETASSGLLADVCNNLSGFDNPVDNGTERITYSTTGIDQADCTIANEQICVQVLRASLQNGTYVVHTKEWMRVKVSDVANTGKRGYWTSKKKVTKSFCAINEALSFKADLK